MSETVNPEQESIATPEENQKFLEQRKKIEEYYKTLVDAHKNEHEYIKMMSEMAEYELRNKMAIMKMAQLEAELQRNKEAAGEKPERKLKADA